MPMTKYSFFFLVALNVLIIISPPVPLALMTSPRGYGMHLEHHIKALGEEEGQSLMDTWAPFGTAKNIYG